jgi:hypothetical protein
MDKGPIIRRISSNHNRPHLQDMLHIYLLLRLLVNLILDICGCLLIQDTYLFLLMPLPFLLSQRAPAYNLLPLVSLP